NARVIGSYPVFLFLTLFQTSPMRVLNDVYLEDRMKKGHALLPVTVLMATSMLWSVAVAETPGPEEAPGAELRVLEQLDPNRFRAPKPITFEVPEAPPMKALPNTELAVSSYELTGNTIFDDSELLVI